MHGANRLGSNSLIDLVVFGRAAAIRAGKVTSASEHYYSSGAREFRAPNAAALDGCGKWKASINKAP